MPGEYQLLSAAAGLAAITLAASAIGPSSEARRREVLRIVMVMSFTSRAVGTARGRGGHRVRRWWVVSWRGLARAARGLSEHGSVFSRGPGAGSNPRLARSR